MTIFAIALAVALIFSPLTTKTLKHVYDVTTADDNDPLDNHEEE